MKRYVVEIIIEEGNDEFWESLNEEQKTGCDDIRDSIKDLIAGGGYFDAQVKIKEFTDKE